MRLLLAVPSIARGGAEEYALSVATAALRCGWAMGAAVPHAPGTESLRADLARAGIAVKTLAHAGPPPAGRVSRIRADLLGVVAFARRIHRDRPDVVHFTLPWPTNALPCLVACAALHVPAVVVFQLVPDATDLVGRVRRRLYRWALGRGQTWVAVADHQRRTLAELFDVDERLLSRIYNGIPLGDGLAAKPATSPPPAGSHVVAVGRLSAQKGHVDLIAAAKQIASERPDLRVVVIGEGEERPRLEAMIAEGGLKSTVTLAGHRGDVAELTRRANLFVFPSHYEGFPFALLEAMALGVPVVAARFGGADEVIEEGRSGLLVPVGDPASLAAAITAVLDDEPMRRRLGTEGARRAGEFSHEQMIGETLRALRERASAA